MSCELQEMHGGYWGLEVYLHKQIWEGVEHWQQHKKKLAVRLRPDITQAPSVSKTILGCERRALPLFDFRITSKIPQSIDRLTTGM